MDGEEVSFELENLASVRLDEAPANGSRVEVRRVTPIDEPLVVFRNSSTLSEESLNTSQRQLLYAVQEARDAVGKLNVDEMVKAASIATAAANQAQQMKSETEAVKQIVDNAKNETIAAQVATQETFVEFKEDKNAALQEISQMVRKPATTRDDALLTLQEDGKLKTTEINSADVVTLQNNVATLALQHALLSSLDSHVIVHFEDMGDLEIDECVNAVVSNGRVQNKIEYDAPAWSKPASIECSIIPKPEERAAVFALNESMDDRWYAAAGEKAQGHWASFPVTDSGKLVSVKLGCYEGYDDVEAAIDVCGLDGVWRTVKSITYICDATKHEYKLDAPVTCTRWRLRCIGTPNYFGLSTVDHEIAAKSSSVSPFFTAVSKPIEAANGCRSVKGVAIVDAMTVAEALAGFRVDFQASSEGEWIESELTGFKHNETQCRLAIKPSTAIESPEALRYRVRKIVEDDYLGLDSIAIRWS